MSCELLLHPFDVLLVGVTLPRLTGAKLASALPGLVEEFVAEEIERNHVVASVRDANNRAIAAVVDGLWPRDGNIQTCRVAGERGHAGRARPGMAPRGVDSSTARGSWRGAHRRICRIGFAYTGEMPVELRLLRQQSAGPPSAIQVTGECDWRLVAALESPVGAAPPDMLRPRSSTCCNTVFRAR